MSCNKNKYDKKTCQTILNDRKKRGKKWSREVRYYYCECGNWHLTSQEEYNEKIPIEEEDLVYKDRWMKIKNPLGN